jgi:sugar lactone lactonase YvrE
MKLQAEVLIDSQSPLGEGAFWDADKKLLYWVDIHNGFLHVTDPQLQVDNIHEFGESVGTVVSCEKGGLLVALKKTVAHFEPVSGTLTRKVEVEEDVPQNRFNDGKCDPAGRFWVGTLCSSENPSQAALYRVDPDFTVHKMLSGVTISNGIVWNRAGTKMYYIDTMTRRVDVFDFDLGSGGISNRACCIEVPETMGMPDGMCIDREDCLWVALWGGWGVACWDPQSGELVEQVGLPAQYVTSCCFGGEDKQQLFITTARNPLSRQEMEKQEHAGSLFRVQTDTVGAAPFAFSG